MPESDLRYLKGQKALKHLSAILRKGNIPHALLFTGIEGIGKYASAIAFAMACNCRHFSEQIRLSSGDDSLSFSDMCTCRSCQKIRSGNHPDIHQVEPSGAFIRIGQIRDLCHILSMKTYEAEMRVVIILQAQTMNPEAANALLKVLEEPPDRTVLILTASQTSDLLPTVVSRCQTIRFGPLSRENIARLLRERHSLSEDEAAMMAVLANGSFAGLGTEADIRKFRERIRWRRWMSEMMAALTDPGSGGLSAGIGLALAEKLAGNKADLGETLALMASWLRDAAVCQYAPDKIVNRDLAEMFRRVSQNISVTSLLSKADAIYAAGKSLRANANLRLTLEILILRLARNIEV